MVPLNNTTLIYYNGALEITIDFLLPFNITKDKINKLMILLWKKPMNDLEQQNLMV
jgi:hypothetical protein